MDKDLKILPLAQIAGSEDLKAKTILSVTREPQLFGEIRAFSERVLPPEAWEDATNKGVTGEATSLTARDAYGQPLYIICARSLALLWMCFGDHHTSSENRAMWEFVKALPPDTLVALYWC